MSKNPSIYKKPNDIFLRLLFFASGCFFLFILFIFVKDFFDKPLDSENKLKTFTIEEAENSKINNSDFVEIVNGSTTNFFTDSVIKRPQDDFRGMGAGKSKNSTPDLLANRPVTLYFPVTSLSAINKYEEVLKTQKNQPVPLKDRIKIKFLVATRNFDRNCVELKNCIEPSNKTFKGIISSEKPSDLREILYKNQFTVDEEYFLIDIDAEPKKNFDFFFLIGSIMLPILGFGGIYLAFKSKL
jgi:hypothetical protein